MQDANRFGPMPPLVVTWWTALAVVTLLRTLAAAHIPLQGTEAYYWLWSEHLAAGYYDHPPLLAWCIHASVAILGKSELAVRLPSLLGVTVATLGVWRLARTMAGDEAGARAGLAALALPYLSMQAVTAFPDGVMLGLCMVSMDLAWNGRLVAAGVALGAGLLEKFTAVLVGGATLVWVRSPRRSWAWALAALATVSPFLVWNARNGWVTFAFQLGSRQRVENHFDLGQLGEFVALQLLTVSPVLCVAMLMALVSTWREGRPEGRFLGWHYMIPMAPFAAYACVHRVEPQWPIVAWLPALVALGVAAERSPRLASAWKGGLAVGIPLTALLLGVGLFPRLLFAALGRPEGVSATQPFAFAELARVASDRAEGRLLMTPEHGYTSALQFYGAGPVHWYSYNLHGRQFLAWEDYAAMKGRDALFIDACDPRKEAYTRLILRLAFETVGAPEAVTIAWNGLPARTFWLWPCKGFRGQPPDYALLPPSVRP